MTPIYEQKRLVGSTVHVDILGLSEKKYNGLTQYYPPPDRRYANFGVIESDNLSHCERYSAISSDIER